MVPKSYWRKSEEVPKALMSSVGQLPVNSLPLLFPSSKDGDCRALPPLLNILKDHLQLAAPMICCNISPATWLFSLSQAGCGRVGHNTVLNNSYHEKYNTVFPIIILLCLDTNVEQRITFNFYLVMVLHQDLAKCCKSNTVSIPKDPEALLSSHPLFHLATWPLVYFQLPIYFQAES